ncbi:MAG: hypothetical protein RLZZ551_1408 [Actinomycetota bacterium]
MCSPHDYGILCRNCEERSAVSKIVLCNRVATLVFSVVAVVSAIFFTSALRVAIVAVSLVLFAVGVATFLLGYFAAVQRSREEEIAVTQLFFLAGDVAPKNVRLAMWYCLAAQCVVGLGVALARPSTDGKAGSVMAFAVMVPMLGIGLNGLWAGKFGTFGPRQLKSAPE